ncbi:Itgbl1 [Columba guinea]|nr:Itgbl1 [Columba guinea]
MSRQGLPGLAVLLLLVTRLPAGHPAPPAGTLALRSGLGSSPSCRLSQAESELRCRVPGGKLCSDRGRCECGVCICQVTEAGKYYGPLCECHDWVCEVYDGKVCAGHGKCDCGKCKCDEGWYGEACQYPTTCNLTRKKSNEMCKNSQDIICSGAGTCQCGRCKCAISEGNGLVYGKFCECDDRECIDDETEEICSGHGKCYCGNCYCEAGWHGDKCEFQCDITPWEIKKRCTSPDGKICSNRGSSPSVMSPYCESINNQAHVYVGNAHAMMWTQLVTGVIFMEILVSVMKETAKRCMIDILMTSVQVMDSVIVEGVTVKKDGLGRSVNIHVLVHCQLRKVLRNAKEILIYLALEEGDVNVANALVSLQETTEFMAKTVNVMIDSVKMQTAMSVGFLHMKCTEIKINKHRCLTNHSVLFLTPLFLLLAAGALEIEGRQATRIQDNRKDQFEIDSIMLLTPLILICSLDHYSLNCHGICSCGRCICQDGWFGKMCQHSRKCNMTEEESRSLCESADGILCSGKGSCHCGKCICSPQEWYISGDFCECDDRDCDKHDGLICTGNGVCNCGNCECWEGWNGNACEIWLGREYP